MNGVTTSAVELARINFPEFLVAVGRKPSGVSTQVKPERYGRKPAGVSTLVKPERYGREPSGVLICIIGHLW